MCGICGYIQKDKIKTNDTILSMKDSIIRRGNSDNNIYVNNNVALGHARLSIIDVKNGKQPMKRCINGRNYAISYNGELYNTNVLRNILITRGYEFETESDTEVLLLLYVEFKEKMLKFIRLNFGRSVKMKKTKIICSIGPSTQKWENFKGIVEAGMNVARINFQNIVEI